MRSVIVVAALLPAMALAQPPVEFRLAGLFSTSPMERSDDYHSRASSGMSIGVAIGNLVSTGTRFSAVFDAALYTVDVNAWDAFAPRPASRSEAASVLRGLGRVSVPWDSRHWRVEMTGGVSVRLADEEEYACWCGPVPRRRAVVSPAAGIDVRRELPGGRLSLNGGLAWSRHFHRPATEVRLGLAAR